MKEFALAHYWLFFFLCVLAIIGVCSVLGDIAKAIGKRRDRL